MIQQYRRRGLSVYRIISNENGAYQTAEISLEDRKKSVFGNEAEEGIWTIFIGDELDRRETARGGFEVSDYSGQNYQLPFDVYIVKKVAQNQ